LAENIDRFGRRITYLRVSVTDRCNLRCIYCMPASGVPWRSHDEILRYEEIARIVRVAARLGIRKVRLTGGEPLVREGIVKLVAELQGIPGIEELVMTTNGTLLSRYALAGIAAAQEAGLAPIKLNAVVMRGINDDEVADLAALSREGFGVRFIEWMPIGEPTDVFTERFVPGEEIKARIEDALGRLAPVRVGFVTAFSAPFCSTCNRIRLTADGRLRPCLLSTKEIDLRDPLRAGATEAEIRRLFERGIREKPFAHGIPSESPHDRTMSEIGG